SRHRDCRIDRPGGACNALVVDDLEQAFVSAGRRRRRVVAIVAALVSLAVGVLVVCISAAPAATPHGYWSHISPVTRAIVSGCFIVLTASIFLVRMYRDRRDVSR